MPSDVRMCRVCGKTVKANSGESAHAETTDKSMKLDCEENTEHEQFVAAPPWPRRKSRRTM